MIPEKLVSILPIGRLGPAAAILLIACGSAGNPAPDTAAPAGAASATHEAVESAGAAVMVSAEVGFYTTEQAERGRSAFTEVCSECHAASEFRGRDFEWNWRRQTARNLYREISGTMPEDDPGSLTDAQYVDLVAYFLSMNDYPAGQVELTATDEVLDAVPLGPNALGGLEAR